MNEINKILILVEKKKKKVPAWIKKNIKKLQLKIMTVVN